MKKLLVLFILFFCVLFLIPEEAIVEEMSLYHKVIRHQARPELLNFILS